MPGDIAIQKREIDYIKIKIVPFIIKSNLEMSLFYQRPIGNNVNSNVGMDKLRTYRLITQQFGFEKISRKQRKTFAAFRISAHKL